MTRVRIAVVNSKSFGLYTDAIARLSEVGDVDRIEVDKNLRGRKLAEKLQGYHFVVASVTPYYDREFFMYNDTVVMIARHGIGYDNIDVKAAEEYGVTVSVVPGWRERDSVAEHTVGLILAALRKIVEAHEAVKEGRWGERAKFMGRELKGLKVCVVGFGNIGSRVAEILSKGFNAEVIAYDPYVPRERITSQGYRYAEKLDDLAEECDIITLHAALTPENRHMLNEKFFEKIKKRVIIVNAARGELVDTEALIKYLEKGVISAYAADVVEGEPIGADHPLLKYPNVIITPHIAAYTYEAMKGMDNAVVEAIINYLNGKPIEAVVARPSKPRTINVSAR